MDLGLSNLVTPALEWLNSFIGNYGVSIILATIMMRLLLLPLDIKQRKSSIKMRQLQPEINEINKRYANDPNRRAQMTQDLYKRNKVGMLSGCLPLLIQLPIIAAFFTAMRVVADNHVRLMYELVQSGQMEQLAEVMRSSHFLWIGNVWQPDAAFNLNLGMLFGQGTLQAVPVIPDAAAVAHLNLANYEQVMAGVMAQYNTQTNGLFILAILAGVVNYLQNKLLPVAPVAEGAPNTGKTMGIVMTIFSVFMCVIYNAAFGIYWLTTSLMAMGLQALLNWVYDPERKARKRAKSDVPLDAFPDRKKKKQAKEGDK
nr:YidC/Oxa1 family membrane protein insertase [Maliibacterium massiliense]